MSLNPEVIQKMIEDTERRMELTKERIDTLPVGSYESIDAQTALILLEGRAQRLQRNLESLRAAHTA